MEPEFTDGKLGKRSRKGNLGERYVCNMTDLKFDKKYNLIYSNWGLNYLDDKDVLALLERARDSLLSVSANKKPGTFIVKETVADGEFSFIEEQQMLVRTTQQYLDLFKKAGYQVKKKSELQKFDSSRLKCQMFAIQPEKLN